MITVTIDMLGWTPNKGKPITGHTGHPREHLPNQRLRKLDKLSHNAHHPDRLSQGGMQNTLNKRGCKSPTLQTNRATLSREQQDELQRHHQKTLQETRQET